MPTRAECFEAASREYSLILPVLALRLALEANADAEIGETGAPT